MNISITSTWLSSKNVIPDHKKSWGHYDYNICGMPSFNAWIGIMALCQLITCNYDSSVLVIMTDGEFGICKLVIILWDIQSFLFTTVAIFTQQKSPIIQIELMIWHITHHMIIMTSQQCSLFHWDWKMPASKWIRQLQTWKLNESSS